MSISSHGWGFGGDSVTREWRLGRVNLLLLVSHLITMGVLHLLEICLVLFILFEHSFIFQWVSHVFRLKLNLIKFLTIWRTLISILLGSWLHRNQLISVLLGARELIMFVCLLFNSVLGLVHLLHNRLIIGSIDWAFLMILFFGIEALHWFGAIWVKTRLLLILLLVD